MIGRGIGSRGCYCCVGDLGKDNADADGWMDGELLRCIYLSCGVAGYITARAWTPVLAIFREPTLWYSLIIQ